MQLSSKTRRTSASEDDDAQIELELAHRARVRSAVQQWHRHMRLKKMEKR
jgi:hypothetical protein